MKLELEITLSDGTKATVVAKAADFIAFEDKFDISVATLSNQAKITHLFYLAWHAQKREGVTELDWEPWLETVDMVSPNTAKK